MICFCTLFCLCFLSFVQSLNNGLAITPPMGWMTWGFAKCTTDCTKYPDRCISENLIIKTTDEFIAGGYADAGYEYIIIDDCWMKKMRDKSGNLIADEIRFPHGMHYVSKYIHKAGLKFGIYETYGKKTCEGYAGSMGHEMNDVNLFHKWEVDYLKLDGCFTRINDLNFGYPEFSRLLNETGRHIVFSCSWPYYLEQLYKVPPNYNEVQKYCNLFRTYHDIEDSWQAVKYIIRYYETTHKKFAQYSKPGSWNDPDMLMIGNNGLNVGQSRIQMAVWAILAAPLIMSNDLKHVSSEMKAILLNPEVIAVDQDPLGIQGGIYKDVYGDFKIWMRKVIPVKGDHYSFAVAFVNMHEGGPQSVIVDMEELDLKNPFGYTVLDLYEKKELANITKVDKLTVFVEPTDVVFYKFQVL